MRRPIIAGNHKMNLLASDSKQFIRKLLQLINNKEKAEVILFPSYTSLTTVVKEIKNSEIAVGAQNAYYQKQGAYTGEVSVEMIKDLSCEWILCGHSERRNIFLETNEDINLKIKATLDSGLKAILCIGEKETHRQNGETEDFLTSQLYGSLKGLKESMLENIVIAYEPIWAIGTGKTATATDAQNTVKFIREKLAEMYSSEFASKTRILYGGSVKPANIRELMSQQDIDGVLVGGASLDASSFAQLIKYE